MTFAQIDPALMPQANTWLIVGMVAILCIMVYLAVRLGTVAGDMREVKADLKQIRENRQCERHTEQIKTLFRLLGKHPQEDES